MPASFDNPLARLATLIDYPEIPAQDARVFEFLVDQAKTTAELMKDGRLLLRHDLCYLHEIQGDCQSLMAQLLGMAFGRSLKEDTILAYDPSRDAVFLWRAAEPPESDTQFISDFEHFTASYEWWDARVKGILEPRPQFPDIYFRP